VVFPLLFGGRNVGFITLYFKDPEAATLVNSELLVALAQQATLAIEIMRLAHSAKEAAVLVERNRIGREIHDGLAQAFTGILMQLAAAEDFEGAEQCATQGLIAQRIRDLAREGLAEARRSVMALRPDQTRSGGLELALRQLAERSSVVGRTVCSFEGRAPATGLAPEHEHALLRIAQEAVSNAVRHGHPQHVRISLIGEAAHWLLTVADDGQGMQDSPDDSAEHGFGLTNMRERATAIGGTWRIETNKGQGTRVCVRLPRRNIP
jgi:signal transduction histidine kinase